MRVAILILTNAPLPSKHIRRYSAPRVAEALCDGNPADGKQQNVHGPPLDCSSQASVEWT